MELHRGICPLPLQRLIAHLVTIPHPYFSGTTQDLCNVIEAVFIHGLKDAFFVKNSRYSKYPEPNFWPFASKITHKGIRNQIAAFKQIKSEIGKARVRFHPLIAQRHNSPLTHSPPPPFRHGYGLCSTKVP